MILSMELPRRSTSLPEIERTTVTMTIAVDDPSAKDRSDGGDDVDEVTDFERPRPGSSNAIAKRG